MLIELDPYLYGKKKPRWIPEVMPKNIGTVCVMLKREKYIDSCKVIKDQKYDTWLKYFFNGRDKGEILLCSVEVKYPKVIKVISVG